MFNPYRASSKEERKITIFTYLFDFLKLYAPIPSFRRVITVFQIFYRSMFVLILLTILSFWPLIIGIFFTDIKWNYGGASFYRVFILSSTIGTLILTLRAFFIFRHDGKVKEWILNGSISPDSSD